MKTHHVLDPVLNSVDTDVNKSMFIPQEFVFWYLLSFALAPLYIQCLGNFIHSHDFVLGTISNYADALYSALLSTVTQIYSVKNYFTANRHWRYNRRGYSCINLVLMLSTISWERWMLISGTNKYKWKIRSSRNENYRMLWEQNKMEKGI